MFESSDSRHRTNQVLKRVVLSERSYLNSGATHTGALTPYAQNCAAMIRDNKDREKREIADLNNRLARYVEKVRFLAAQNQVLSTDIDLFRRAANIHSERISVYFESERKSLHTLVMENDSKIKSAEQLIRKMEPELLSTKRSIGDILEQRQHKRRERQENMKRLSDIESENSYIKRLINDSEDEKTFLTSELGRIRGEIKKIQALREKEKSDGVRAHTHVQELLKKINGSISHHEISIREEISKARRDSTSTNRDYFHNELHSAMKDIRDQFERDARASRSHWEEWYRKKIADIKKNSEQFSNAQSLAREETLRIRSSLNSMRNKISDIETVNQQLVKRIEDIHYREDEELRQFETSLNEKENAVLRMREECAKLSVELDQLCDNQINLHQEISYYRKLMENAENIRLSVNSNVVIDTPSPVMRTSFHSYGSAYNSDINNRLVSTRSYESLASVPSHTFTSYARGDVKFVSHSENGYSITIENMNHVSSKDLSNWRLEHYVKGELRGSYTFPIATHIQPFQKIIINARSSTNLLDFHVAMNIDRFDFSRYSKTILLNDAEEEVGWYAHDSYNH